jgi:hypothetical protein
MRCNPHHVYPGIISPVLCSLAGYAPCLAAAKKLHAAGLLKEEVPGKVGGRPGNTFELVYGPTVRDKIWAKLYSVDAVLADWIRCAVQCPHPSTLPLSVVV